MDQDTTIGEFERRKLFRPGFSHQLRARSAQKRKSISVRSNYFFVLDAGRAQRFLHLAARVKWWTAVIAVTDEERGNVIPAHRHSTVEAAVAFTRLVPTTSTCCMPCKLPTLEAL